MSTDLWDSKIESMPINKLKELQLKRLKELVSRVYSKNKYYKEKFDEAGIKPSDIKTLKDIEKLPFLTKQDLRKYYPFGLVCTEIDEIVEVHASSGTTGKPVVGPYTRNDVESMGRSNGSFSLCKWSEKNRSYAKLPMDTVFLQVLMVLKKVHKK